MLFWFKTFRPHQFVLGFQELPKEEGQNLIEEQGVVFPSTVRGSDQNR